jgi:hypothetical protein
MGKIEENDANKIVEGLLNLLNSKNILQRLNAIEALSMIGGPRITQELSNLLNDDDVPVREAAARALKKFSDADSAIQKNGSINSSNKGFATSDKDISSSNYNNSYKVVPFNPSDNVSDSLQRIINSETSNGWKYVNHQYSDKLQPGSAGCFGIGATPDSTVHIGFVIFEKNN